MKILIIKTSSLGDIIQSFPALDYLRTKFPQSQIDWIVESSFAELVRANPQIDRVLVFESKKWRKKFFCQETLKELLQFRKKLKTIKYDLLFDLQGNLKSSFLVWIAHAKQKVGFGWKTVHEWPNAFFTQYKINPKSGENICEDYLAIIKNYFKDKNHYDFQPILLNLEPLQQQKLMELFKDAEKPTLVCPSSTWANKCLLEDSLIKLLKHIKQEPYWFIWGNLQEREKALRIALHFPNSVVLERLSLPVLQHVMSKCKLVISMDSLPLHLCATTATPSLSFFGPSSAKKFAPLGPQHCAVQGICPYGQQFEKTCLKLRTCKTGACLKQEDKSDNWIETVNQFLCHKIFKK